MISDPDKLYDDAELEAEFVDFLIQIREKYDPRRGITLSCKNYHRGPSSDVPDLNRIPIDGVDQTLESWENINGVSLQDRFGDRSHRRQQIMAATEVSTPTATTTSTVASTSTATATSVAAPDAPEPTRVDIPVLSTPAPTRNQKALRSSTKKGQVSKTLKQTSGKLDTFGYIF